VHNLSADNIKMAWAM